MSVSVEIFKVPEPVEKQVPVIAWREFSDIPFLEDNFLQESIDLNKWVSGDRRGTFYAKVKGNTRGSKYKIGDVVVVDRSWPVQNSKPAVCCIGNEFEIRQVRFREEGIWLEPYNESETPILLTEENQFLLWGMITYEVKRIW